MGDLGLVSFAALVASAGYDVAHAPLVPVPTVPPMKYLRRWLKQFNRACERFLEDQEDEDAGY